ncbi:LTA synthase family protein [Anaerobutyricum hallii]|nr:LTA synthase family protein [Anaerobutyricum hallii]
MQLESFFDATTVKNLKVSEDPIPTFHKIQKEYTSGYLKVPVYGAGTINTEFEVITGMNMDYFGTGEYPYRSILHKTTCDSVAYWLKEKNYESSVIHNNNASFYDRDAVFSNLGFNNFITIENMDVKSRNEVGWAKDSILTTYIMDTLNQTKKKDIIYTISVQGHGDYPTDDQSGSPITVSGEGMSQSYLNQFTYYVNQTREMDDFIKDLTDKLSDYHEDVMVIAYGDHLPGMNLESKDLKTNSKYETPYFIWDNFGYNKENKKKQSGKVEAWQLASKVLKEVGIHNGFLNEYHQTMEEDKKYRKNLKLLQYDMLYGSNFVREDKKSLEPTKINYSLSPVEITEIKEDRDDYLLLGNNFTDASRVFVNGVRVASKKESSSVLEIPKSAVKEGDKITVHQVSVTNENITLNQSEEYEFHKDKVRLLYKNLYDE